MIYIAVSQKSDTNRKYKKQNKMFPFNRILFCLEYFFKIQRIITSAFIWFPIFVIENSKLLLASFIVQP